MVTHKITCISASVLVSSSAICRENLPLCSFCQSKKKSDLERALWSDLKKPFWDPEKREIYSPAFRDRSWHKTIDRKMAFEAPYFCSCWWLHLQRRKSFSFVFQQRMIDEGISLSGAIQATQGSNLEILFKASCATNSIKKVLVVNSFKFCRLFREKRKSLRALQLFSMHFGQLSIGPSFYSWTPVNGWYGVAVQRSEDTRREELKKSRSSSQQKMVG